MQWTSKNTITFQQTIFQWTVLLIAQNMIIVQTVSNMLIRQSLSSLFFYPLKKKKKKNHFQTVLISLSEQIKNKTKPGSQGTQQSFK